MTTALYRLGALVAGLGLVSAGCSTENILDVEDPDVINPDAINSSAGAAALYAGALGEFSFAVVGDAGGTEGQILVGGLMTDEYIHSGTFPTRLEYEQRKSDERNGTLTAVFRNLQRARFLLEATVPALRQYSPTPRARIGEAWALAGLTYIWFGESYCSGVPFSTGEVFGTPMTTREIFTLAAQRFDSARADSGTSAIANLARVGKGRALLNLAQTPAEFATAAAAVAAVPLTFVYQTTHTLTSSRQQNGVHVFNWLSERWSVADTQGINGLNFRSANDPRVKWFRDSTGTGVGFDNNTPQFNLLKYPARTTAMPIATGVEAKLMIAEALLQGGNTTAWLDTLNFLRGRLRSLASVAATDTLLPLADPGTAPGRVDLMFRERAFWMFATGHRLGDLRRLMRQYGRAEDAVFPTGAHFKGGTYGDDVNLPVPFDERNNPNFTGCIDRSA